MRLLSVFHRFPNFHPDPDERTATPRFPELTFSNSSEFSFIREHYEVLRSEILERFE